MAAVWRIPSTSLEYLPVVITGGAITDGVQVAIVPRGLDEPADSDWHPVDLWDGTTAQLLIGPGGTLTLTDGMFKVFAKVMAIPEIPVIEAGLLRIT